MATGLARASSAVSSGGGGGGAGGVGLAEVVVSGAL